MPTFIGIDLAWQSDRNHSGGAVLEGNERAVQLRELSSGLCTLADVEAFVEGNAGSDTVVAIDAPLVIENVDGQRACETEISRRFGSAHASAHTSNRRLYPDARSVQLAKDLEAGGFRHCLSPLSPHCGGKWFFEVYPHPAHVVLFSRDTIIKYKKGRVAARRAGLMEFRQSLLVHLSNARPSLKLNALLESFLGEPLENLRGAGLKEYEDKLDAVFCAYLAAHFWAWGYARNEMIGTVEQGYIINPIADALSSTVLAGRNIH
jgi:predicted RNase H-like nuclease